MEGTNRKTTARTRPQSDVARSVRKPDPKNSTSAWDEGGVGGASVGYVPRQIKPGCEQVQGCETTPGQLHGQKPADLRARRDRRAEVDLKLHVQQAKSTTQVGKPLLFPVPAALWPFPSHDVNRPCEKTDICRCSHDVFPCSVRAAADDFFLVTRHRRYIRGSCGFQVSRRPMVDMHNRRRNLRTGRLVAH